MPAYRYSHDCGFKQDLWLDEDKETLIVICYRCGNNVRARQVRDKSIEKGEADGVIGIIRNN